MRVSDILIPERVACDLDSTSKKGVLDALTELFVLASPRLSRATILDSLVARERLGSTGLGSGVAIPHGRINLHDETIGAFAKLPKGIDFEANDNQPVDMFFALLVPEDSTEEHLRILSQLAEMFSDGSFLERLRGESSSTDLYTLLTEWPNHAI